MKIHAVIVALQAHHGDLDLAGLLNVALFLYLKFWINVLALSVNAKIHCNFYDKANEYCIFIGSNNKITMCKRLP